MKRRHFILRHLSNLAVHLTAEGLIESCRQLQLPNSYQNAEYTKRIGISVQEGLFKREPDKTLGCKIVNLVHLNLCQNVLDVRILEEFRINELNLW